ncbi:uncharacterized protein ARMOST_21997 [Armillaria ostoyae]|uniref:Uncharacterized protein n=1 Tax=Armillaria ostoyae TaxID=47428 RepID=A0A284SBM8_ARMOS|nr:uncharacterized protein ARMOST_21997 [Armillaria ostoyae]
MTFKANVLLLREPTPSSDSDQDHYEAAFAAAKYTLYSIPVLETVLTNITELAATFESQCVASDRYKKERLFHSTIPVLDTARRARASFHWFDEQIAHSLHPSSFKLNQESESPQTCKVPMRFYARFKLEFYKKFEAAIIMDPGPWIAVTATWPREARARLTTTNPPFIV